MTEAKKRRAKRKAPWRGLRQVDDPRTRRITVRCTEEERAAIREVAASAGFSVGAYMRLQALGDPGQRAVRRPPVERVELAKLLGHIGKTGSNINQIAYAWNRERRFPGFPEILAIREEVAQMRAALMTALGKEP
jgi:hypothetical protein